MTARAGRRPVVLITGGARRVGAAIARSFAAAGCDVEITYRQSADEAVTLASSLEQQGVSAAAHALDLDRLDDVERFGEQRARKPLDVLVHNASIYGPSPLETVSVDDALRHYRVNAVAPLLLSKHLAPALRNAALPGGGAIVAMADMHALGRPRKDFAAYAMSKAALIEMVRTLARALAPRIRVNAVAPGVVAFPESGYESDPGAQRAYVERVPLARCGTPEDAAETVRWLALDAHYVTGEIIRVDGGRWLA